MPTQDDTSIEKENDGTAEALDRLIKNHEADKRRETAQRDTQFKGSQAVFPFGRESEDYHPGPEGGRR